MKKITRIFLFLLLTTFVSHTNAQTKIAHINSQELINAMPEMKEAKAEFDMLQQSLGADIQISVTEYRNKLTRYTNEAPTKTEAENDARNKELEELQISIQKARAAAQKTADQKYTDLTKAIQDKASAAIQKVARAMGFTYVLDSTAGSGLLLTDGTDLLEAVKKELDID